MPFEFRQHNVKHETQTNLGQPGQAVQDQEEMKQVMDGLIAAYPNTMLIEIMSKFNWCTVSQAVDSRAFKIVHYRQESEISNLNYSDVIKMIVGSRALIGSHIPFENTIMIGKNGVVEPEDLFAKPFVCSSNPNPTIMPKDPMTILYVQYQPNSLFNGFGRAFIIVNARADCYGHHFNGNFLLYHMNGTGPFRFAFGNYLDMDNVAELKDNITVGDILTSFKNRGKIPTITLSLQPSCNSQIGNFITNSIQTLNDLRLEIIKIDMAKSKYLEANPETAYVRGLWIEDPADPGHVNIMRQFLNMAYIVHTQQLEKLAKEVLLYQHLPVSARRQVENLSKIPTELIGRFDQDKDYTNMKGRVEEAFKLLIYEHYDTMYSLTKKVFNRLSPENLMWLEMRIPSNFQFDLYRVHPNN